MRLSILEGLIMDTITKEHKAKINKYLDGIYNLSPTASESYFSWSSCECCGSTLGGNRYDFTGTVGKAHNNERIELSCCVDCFGYLFT
jgi:hypothetical protein